MQSSESLARRIGMAMGREPVDVLVVGARVVDVFSGEVFETSVGVADGSVRWVRRVRGS